MNITSIKVEGYPIDFIMSSCPGHYELYGDTVITKDPGEVLAHLDVALGYYNLFYFIQPIGENELVLIIEEGESHYDVTCY